MEAVTTILEAESNPAQGVNGRPYSELVEEAGGVDALDALQSHANKDVYEKAAQLIETYFGGEESDEEEDENVVPAAPKAFTFGGKGLATGPGFGAGPGAIVAQPAGAFSFGFLATTQFK
jgi:importin subunit alpha-1